MPSTFLKPGDGDIYRDAPAPTVWTKEHWGDEWTLQPYLYCDRLNWASNSVRPEARLQWRYGMAMPAGTAGFSEYAPKDLLSHYLNVTIPQTDGDDLQWYGIITDDGRQRAGGIDPGDARTQSGQQTLAAEGLDLLLMRTIISSSWISTGDTATVREIRRGLTFNSPNAFEDHGNRCVIAGPNRGYPFAHSMQYADWWSSYEIIDYLLKYHPPCDASGLTMIPIELTASASKVLPSWDHPVVRSHGRSLRSIINELCRRDRNLNWTLTVDANGNINLDVETYLPSVQKLPSGAVQEANQSQVELSEDGLDIDFAADVQASLRDSDHAKVEQVVVRGARIRVVGSFSAADGTLDADWTDNAETEYETAPTAIAALTNAHEKQARMKAYRAEDARSRVFCWFRVPTTWNGELGDGAGGRKTYHVPLDENDKRRWIYMPEFRFCRHLAKELYDRYPSNSPRELPPPIALAKLPDGTYQHVELLSVTAGIESHGEGAGRDWSCSLRVQPDAPGVILKVHGGDARGGQHLLAATDFTPIDGIDRAGELDWQDIIVTVMFEIDSHVEERYPATKDLPDQVDVARIRYIDIGERGREDWVHAAAVIGVEDGALRYLNGATPGYNGKYVRYDRDWMADLARFVYEWYGQKRQTFTLSLKQLSSIVKVNDLITKIGDGNTETEVNALVTGVQMDLISGTTRITTGFAELDPIQLI